MDATSINWLNRKSQASGATESGYPLSSIKLESKDQPDLRKGSFWECVPRTAERVVAMPFSRRAKGRDLEPLLITIGQPVVVNGERRGEGKGMGKKKESRFVSTPQRHPVSAGGRSQCHKAAVTSRWNRMDGRQRGHSLLTIRRIPSSTSLPLFILHSFLPPASPPSLLPPYYRVASTLLPPNERPLLHPDRQ